MALLQALISFISRSAGKILNAIFGWAVVALFGRAPPRQHTLLTILVAMAALWPILLVGVAVPKIAAMALAFVPIGDAVPTWAVRIVWIVLALAVPMAIGLTIAAKAPPGSPAEPFVKRVLRGVPVTLGIAGAFLLMFVTVPALRIASILRGRKDEHVPLITSGDEYEQAAVEIDRVVERHSLGALRVPPSWWLAAPSKVLAKLGGKALRGFLPTKMAYWKGPNLEIALYPSDILVRGKKNQTAWTHGLLDETFAAGPGLMTHDAAAQEIEREIQRIWRRYDENPRAHEGSRALLGRLDDVAREIGKLHVEYAQWQIVYRKSVQLGRALRGEPQLLRATTTSREDIMAEELERVAAAPRPLADEPTGQLVAQLVKQSTELVKKEVELARAELKSDIKREVGMAKGLGIAGVCALTGLNLLLVAAVFGLATVMEGWAAALLVAGVVLAIGTVAGLIGWSKRVKTPLERTQKTLKEDVKWAKERMA